MKLLVHLHIYYHEQLDWYLEKLSYIKACPWDLVVTWSGEHPQSEAKIRAFRPDAHILPVSNAGYDIWPFLHILKTLPLDAYDAVLKLHTKNTDERTNIINGIRLSGTKWRDCLVLPLLESTGQFQKTLQCLEKDPQCGMLCSGYLIRQPSRYLPEDSCALDAEMQRIGLQSKDRRFCAGSMFLARISPYLPLKDLDLSEADFESGASSHAIGTMAHIYERIISIAVSAEGYRLKPAPYRCTAYFFWKCGRTLGLILKQIFEINHSHIDGKKYITLLGVTFPLQ